MTSTELIEMQNKLTDLNKKSRELASNIKYDVDFLKKLNTGFYDNAGADFVKYNLPRMTEELAKHEAAKAAVDEKIANIESDRRSIASMPHNGLLPFFSGTGLENARFGLELLAMCLENRGWLPGASRRIQSVLSPAKATKKTRPTYALAFRELETMFRKWNATRPAPTFTTAGASPTVTATLKSMEAVSVEVCPMTYEVVEYLNEKHQIAFRTVVTLVWPEGTLHGTSRFSETCNNLQCQACGHAIKNAFNWVPLVLTTASGVSKSLWVGRDCAKTLFGIELTGELEIVGGKQ